MSEIAFSMPSTVVVVLWPTRSEVVSSMDLSMSDVLMPVDGGRSVIEVVAIVVGLRFVLVLGVGFGLVVVMESVLEVIAVVVRVEDFLVVSILVVALVLSAMVVLEVVVLNTVFVVSASVVALLVVLSVGFNVILVVVLAVFSLVVVSALVVVEAVVLAGVGMQAQVRRLLLDVLLLQIFFCGQSSSSR